MRRREFMKAGAFGAPSLFWKQGAEAPPKTHVVPADADRYGETHTLGFSQLKFKTASADTGGGVFILEHDNLQKGGPYRHFHPAQDEWMYAMAGTFQVEIGEQKVTLHPGDSVLMPRKVPHVWAQTGETPGKLLIAFTPAGRMEDFFRDFGKLGKLPSDASIVGPYGLVRVGPPLSV